MLASLSKSKLVTTLLFTKIAIEDVTVFKDQTVSDQLKISFLFGIHMKITLEIYSTTFVLCFTKINVFF